jgi:hypothetical protein
LYSDQFSIKSGQGRVRGGAGSNMTSYAFGDSFAVRPKAKRSKPFRYCAKKSASYPRLARLLKVGRTGKRSIYITWFAYPA